MAKKKGGALGEAEQAQSTWACSNYRSFFGQRISIAVNTYTAREILDAILHGPRRPSTRVRKAASPPKATQQQAPPPEGGGADADAAQGRAPSTESAPNDDTSTLAFIRYCTTSPQFAINAILQLPLAAKSLF